MQAYVIMHDLNMMQVEEGLFGATIGVVGSMAGKMGRVTSDIGKSVVGDLHLTIYQTTAPQESGGLTGLLNLSSKNICSFFNLCTRPRTALTFHHPVIP